MYLEMGHRARAGIGLERTWVRVGVLGKCPSGDRRMSASPRSQLHKGGAPM